MDDSRQPPSDPPATEAPPPDTDSTAVAARATTGWVVPAPASRPPSRTFVIFAWIAAVLIVGFLALMVSAAAGISTPRGVGRMIGAFIGPFLVAAIARFVVVLLGRGKPGAPVGVIRSHWVPLGAIALATLGGISSLSSVAAPTPVDPATALRVAPPFTITDTDAATIQEMQALYGEDPTVGEIVVREIVGEDGSVSIIVVVDGQFREDDPRELARGMEEGSDLTATVETIGGREIAVAHAPTASVGSWIEKPLLLAVYAPDELTLREVVAAVVTAPRTTGG